jgi:E1A/CREB-binding protein
LHTIPYLEGDYWIGDAEVRIQEIEDENKAAGRNVEVSPDELVLRIGNILCPIRESFFVINLAPPSFASSGEAIAAAEGGSDTAAVASESFQCRANFIELCKGNDYQFDTERRAKHSTMMVLYHLHRPDDAAAAPFLHTCASCYQNIQGRRYHCATCPSGAYDLCVDCAGIVRHEHQLTSIAIGGKERRRRRRRQEATTAGGELVGGQKGRAESLRLHLVLLEHAHRCQHLKCQVPSCMKLKHMLRHANAPCAERQQNAAGCSLCGRVLWLLREHARQCNTRDCTVLRCGNIKERLREIADRQEVHDNRRRPKRR